MRRTHRLVYSSLRVSDYNWHINVLLDLTENDEDEAKALALPQPVAFHVLKVQLHYIIYMKKS